ncbi:putative virion structural protein 14 [Salmonella phage SPAsTU]|nr:putative virion structural protein 14 [Salmonella phage SPAsTU]
MGIKLRWNDQSAQQLDAIEIYRSANVIDISNPGAPYKTLAGTAVEFEDTDVRNKELWHYRLAAVKGEERAWGEDQVGGYFSETGPGRDTPLRGTWAAGFMEMLPVADFITGPDLRLKVPALGTWGSAWNPSYWFKMVHNGNIIYVPDSNIVTATWNELYNAGLVYGTNDFGKTPLGDAGAVNQRTVIEINGLEYILRLPRISAKPTSEYITGTADMQGSEWKDVISRLNSSTISNDPSARTRLFDTTSGWITISPHWTKENTASNVVAANNEVLGAGIAIGTRATVMLVLELVQP